MNKVIGNQKHGRAAELLRRLEKELHYDPVKELVSIAQRSGTNTATKVAIAKEIMKYRYPMLKAVEIDAQVKAPVIFNMDLSGNVEDAVKAQEAMERTMKIQQALQEAELDTAA